MRGGRDGSSADVGASEGRRAKRARVDAGDPALALLDEALEAAPTSRMFLEGARFLRLRIRRLLDGDDEEASCYLIEGGEGPEGAARRHALRLEELYRKADESGATSTDLTLDHADFLLNTGRPGEAEAALGRAAPAKSDARLWLRWAEVSQKIETAGLTPTLTPARVLRRALKETPMHRRRDHLAVLTRLMRRLMAAPPSAKAKEELKPLFKKLFLLSRGSDRSASDYKENGNDGGDDEDGGDPLNVASTFLAYLKFAILIHTDDTVRAIYDDVLHRSDYGKSRAGKTEDEVWAMKSLFDACLGFEGIRRDSSETSPGGVETKDKEGRKKEGRERKARRRRLREAATRFFEGGGDGGDRWRNVAEGYRRDLHDESHGIS